MQKSIKIIGNYHNHDASRIVFRGGYSPDSKRESRNSNGNCQKKKAYNTMPNGTCRTLKSQYQKNSVGNFISQGSFGATCVIRKIKYENKTGNNDRENG